MMRFVKEEELLSFLPVQTAFTWCNKVGAFINRLSSDAAFLERGMCGRLGMTRVFGSKTQVVNRPRWTIRFRVSA